MSEYFPDIKKIPRDPGCYIMKDSVDAILYIGKAKNLRHRVSSYFRGVHDTKTTMLVSHIKNIDFIITDTEVEALILEAKLIFKHKPKFNLDLKNSVRYSYIKITNEDFPRIVSVRDVDRVKDIYFGPYPDGTARRESVYALNKIFKLRVCKKLPKRVCLLYHIGQCSAPCENKISKEEYGESMKKAISVLRGTTDEMKKKLNDEMNDFSKDKNYEQARVRRDQIFALRRISERQKISLKKKYDQDFIHYHLSGETFYVQLFNVRKGLIGNSIGFEFDSRFTTIIDALRHYYYANPIPEEIILPKKNDELTLFKSYLEELRGGSVRITIPKKGTKKDLLDLLYKNVVQRLSYEESVLVDLKDVLHLQTLPNRIECFDISNMGSLYTVGAMVSFLFGKPDKKNYRRFKIKTVKGQDDFSMMAEIVKRRYERLKSENKPFPDLIVVDGGQGQLNAAYNELMKLNLSIPIISLAKREELIYFIGAYRPLRLSRKSEALKLVQRCRDEAHRFGLAYHRLLRTKGMINETYGIKEKRQKNK